LQSLNRILAEDIESDIYLPPFDKSAMDGYAISSGDKSRRFFIKETIPAGFVPGIHLNPGECAKIMTGAMLPEGADRVVKKEITLESDGFMTITEEDGNFNVCKKGEDVGPKDLIIKSGKRIKPQDVGVIASLGHKVVKVYKKPLVGIITTGSEIVQPGQQLQKGQIYNSNSYSIAAQLKEMGAEVRLEEITEDKEHSIKRDISNLLKRVDLLVISGGVSMGDYDFVPAILEKMGVNILIKKVAVKPGKPLLLGTMGENIIFGLPGNPVSTFVINEIFVKPVVFRLQGFVYKPLYFKGVLKNDLNQKNAQRTTFIPVLVENEEVTPVEYHGSAHLTALLGANGLLQIPRGINELLKGAVVDVRSL